MAQERNTAVRLEAEGTYQVAILDEPKWFEMKAKDGDTSRMELSLRGYINGGEQDGKWIDGRLLFIRTLYGSGRNMGRSVFEVSAETCLELGMSAPFSPTRIGELVGAVCEFVCEYEEYEKKRYLRVKYINTRSRPAMEVSEAERIWKELQEDGGSMGGTSVDAAPDDATDDGLGLGDDNLPGLGGGTPF